MNEEYINYLKSDKWKNIRKEVAFRDNYSCVRCGKECEDKESLSGFQVHHRNYKYIFNEEQNLDCLIFLCKECHEKISNQQLKRKEKREKRKQKKAEKKERRLVQLPHIFNLYKYACKYCHSNKFTIKKYSRNIGIICARCGKWHKHLNKKELLYLNEKYKKESH